MPVVCGVVLYYTPDSAVSLNPMRPPLALAAGGRTVASFLSAKEWMLPSPATQVHTVSVLPSQSPTTRHEFTFSNLTTSLRNGGGNGVETGNPKFQVVRDDLLHPLANGNKARKLDALLPVLRHCGATDIVRSSHQPFSSFCI